MFGEKFPVRQPRTRRKRWTTLERLGGAGGADPRWKFKRTAEATLDGALKGFLEGLGRFCFEPWGGKMAEAAQWGNILLDDTGEIEGGRQSYPASGRKEPLKAVMGTLKYEIFNRNLRAKGNWVAKKRGNPDWGKPEVNTVPYAGTSSFEEVAKRLRLSPTEYEGSIQLKEWARKNKDQKYVPSNLLQAWGLDVKSGSWVWRVREFLSMRGHGVSDQLQVSQRSSSGPEFRSRRWQQGWDAPSKSWRTSG
jgi:hypothetical protein